MCYYKSKEKRLKDFEKKSYFFPQGFNKVRGGCSKTEHNNAGGRS